MLVQQYAAKMHFYINCVPFPCSSASFNNISYFVFTQGHKIMVTCGFDKRRKFQFPRLDQIKCTLFRPFILKEGWDESYVGVRNIIDASTPCLGS